jgi:hypothetical protein
VIGKLGARRQKTWPADTAATGSKPAKPLDGMPTVPLGKRRGAHRQDDLGRTRAWRGGANPLEQDFPALSPRHQDPYHRSVLSAHPLIGSRVGQV